ncbi:DUF192 domain-containing protein [Candidatus Amesbacteria bacterium]|nr:DUF192 domain-containing protein [Candidatus Amesbacteria bacterium]
MHHIQVPVLFIKQNGWIGMDLLFTLSGFLITNNFLGRPVNLGKFYIKRILRIWPLYFVYLILIGKFSETRPYFLFVWNWRVMFFGWSSFNLVGHLWAISMQEQFYLVYPIFIKYFKNLPKILIVGILISTLLKFYFFDPNNYYLIYMNTFTRLEPFLAGGLLAMYKDKIPRLPSLFIFILGLISFNLINIRESANIWVVVFGYLWVAIWCASTLHLILHNSYFKIQLFKHLASLGFGLYIWHKVGIELSGGNIYIALLITLVLATLSYFIIEKKFLDLKKLFIFFVTLSLCYSVTIVKAFDPLAVPNNRFGVHILDTPEIHEAVKLVNSNGGEWGYVTIPMRSNDRNRGKWVKFFLAARSEKVIPIIRLATYPDKDVWVAPTVYDLVDFANFLSDMPWPVKNRYIILFNEPNHSYEWGGNISPNEYVNLIIDANRIFKDRSQDYFLLTAGLDVSVPNSKTSMDAFEFLRRMNNFQPNWLESVDGISSHAYSNPGFMASPWSQSRFGITGFKYELDYLKTNKPIFITETGTLWESGFWPEAFKVWDKSNIVAITPFVLMAGEGEFAKFSLLDSGGQPKPSYIEIQRLVKIAGSPLLSNIQIVSQPQKLLFTSESFWQKLVRFFKFEKPKSLSKLKVGKKVIEIEIAQNDFEREQGLSGRDGLPTNTGMYFIFEKADRHAFWMKDMKFDLDFIWIQNGRVVYLSEHVSNPATIYPPMPVDRVLEVPSDFVQQNHIAIGDKIEVW